MTSQKTTAWKDRTGRARGELRCEDPGMSYATFVARAAQVKQRWYTTRHSNILIVATTVQ